MNHHKVDGLPPGWAKAELNEIADVRLGRQRSPKNHTGARMRPYLRAANVTWDGLDLSDVKEMNFTVAESETYELREGDVVVAEASGSASEVGKPAIWRGEIEGCCFQNTLIRVRTRHALPGFLRYFVLLEARSGRIGNAAPGVGIHHIGSARLSAWPVPLPPLNEQRRIVAAIEEQLSRLDAADASLVAATRRVTAFHAALVARALSGDWPLVKLGVVTETQGYGTSAKANSDSTGVPVLRMGNVIDGRLDFTNLKYLPANHSDVEKLILEPGDVLFNRTNSPELVGKSAVFGSTDRMTFASYLIRVRLTQDCDPRWAVLAINGPSGRAYVSQVRTQQVGQANVNGTKLAAMPIPLPPLAEQRRIVAQVEEQLSAIDALRAAIERAQRRSASLRRAVLERAFRGELVPQDPTDEPAEALLARIRAGPATKRVQ